MSCDLKLVCLQGLIQTVVDYSNHIKRGTGGQTEGENSMYKDFQIPSKYKC